jgi:hypothetical protein
VAINPVKALWFLQDVTLDVDGEFGLKSLNREDLIAVHKTLTALRDEVEQALEQLALEEDSALLTVPCGSATEA